MKRILSTLCLALTMCLPACDSADSIFSRLLFKIINNHRNNGLTRLTKS